MIYLHENGITVVANDEAKRGKVYELNGEKYYVARSVSDIKKIISSKEYPLNRVVTTKLTSLNGLFEIQSYGKSAVPSDYSEDLTNWDTSNVLTMEEVFCGWPEFNQDISNWDTSMVESMHGMFKSSKYVGSYHIGKTYFNQDISNWDVSNVKNMSEMFMGATSFNQDISTWDVSNVENMSHMFSGAVSFNQSIGNWNVSNVKNMCGMFSDTEAIGIKAFVGSYEYRRAGSSSFNQPIGNWNVGNVENMDYMFSGATSFNQDISNWNVSNVTTMVHMFSGGRKDALVETYSTENTVKNNPTSFNQPIENWDVSNVESMENMFREATAFNQPIGNWNVSKVGNMGGMFREATAFNQDLNGWNISSLSWVEDMFYGATSFNSPIGNWKLKPTSSQSNDNSGISSMKNMFREAIAFNQDISSWDVSSVINMSEMFMGATSFNQDISGWDVSNVIQMKGLFQDAISFNQNLRNWKLNEKLPKSRTMFQGASSFNIKEYNPFLNIKPKERKVDTSTANLSTDDKKTFSKIKKLIISRDNEKIDLGVELLISLNKASIYNSLLDGCKLEITLDNYNDKITKLVTNKLFTGNGPAQPFLNYALLSIIANVPEDDNIRIDDSIRNKNINELDLTSISFRHDYSYHKTPDLSRFIHLKELKISNPNRFDSSLFINKSITKLICNDFEGSLKFLSEMPQLEYLDLYLSSYSNDTISDLDSFQSLVNLKCLNLNSGGKLENINFLSSCKKLEKLTLELSGSSYSSKLKIKNIEAISYLQNLKELNVGLIEQDFRISHIGKCKNLKKLSLKFTDTCNNYDLSELNSCTELTDLKIDGGFPYSINANIHSINGITRPNNLKILNISPDWRSSLNIESINSSEIQKEEDGFKIVNGNDITDIGIVSHYMGEPFNGIMYYTTTIPFSNKRVVGEDYEMVDGLKHGSSKCFYFNAKSSDQIFDNALKSFVNIGSTMLEYKYVDDEFDKIIGFYDQKGNNYVKKGLCLFAKSISYNSEDGKFYYKEDVFSGQVLVHKYASHYRPKNMISLYEIVESVGDQEGLFPDGSFSFLIDIREGKLTGEFYTASANNSFFSVNTSVEECNRPLDMMLIKESSEKNSDILSLENKSIVVTGVFDNYSRNELKELISSKGGKPSSSVTSNTFLILGGSKIGPKKKILADELGVRIIDIDCFIEEFINNSENKITNESLFIDKIFPFDAKKTSVTNKKLKSEDKKTFSKIKSLLQTRDFDKVDMGIELLRSINIIEFYETLLTDCEIINDGSLKFVKNKFFTGSGPAQPYLNYAFYLLIYHCPEEAQIHDSLRRNNITSFKTNMLFSRSYEFKYPIPPIEKLTSLNQFAIDLSAFDLNTNNVNAALKNSSIQKLKIIDSNYPLIWLKNLPQIKFLELGWLSDIDGNHKAFEHLSELEELEINVSQVENIDFLKKCTKIKKLKLSLNGDSTSEGKTNNINSLKFLLDLEDLEIRADHNISASFSFEGLSFCNKLKFLNISSNESNMILENVKNCSLLEKFSLLSKANYDIELQISDFNGLSKLDNLDTICLGGINLIKSNSNIFIN